MGSASWREPWGPVGRVRMPRRPPLGQSRTAIAVPVGATYDGASTGSSGFQSLRIPMSPLSVRFLLLGALVACSACDPAHTAQAPDGLPPYRVSQVETLLETRLPCMGCHMIDGTGGRIGPDLSQVGARLSHAQIDSIVRAPRSRIPTTVMPAVIMREDWRTLVIRYLAERGGQASEALVEGTSPVATPPTRPEGDPTVADLRDGSGADGEALYAMYCASCHGVRGLGDGSNAPTLPSAPTAHGDAQYMSERPDDSLFDAIWGGGYIMGRSHTMPPFGASLTRNEIWALVRHMRTLCDCEGPAWSRDGAVGAQQ